MGIFQKRNGEKKKKNIARRDSQKFDNLELEETPELHTSIFGQLMFGWFNGIMFKGYRSPLQQDDVYTLLPNMQSRYLRDRLEIILEEENEKYTKQVEKCKQQNKKIPSPPLAWAIYRTVGKYFLFGGLLKFISDICSLIQPLIIGYFISYFTERRGLPPARSWPPAIWKGMPERYGGFIFPLILFAVQFALGITQNWHFKLMTSIGVRARSALIALIYKKSLQLSQGAKTEYNAGKVINMISVDCYRIELVFSFIHIIWASPVQLLAIIGLLIWQLSWVALIGIFIILILMPVQAYFLKNLAALRKAAIQITDSRIRAISEIVSSIKVIKYMAWESKFDERVSKLRKSELVKLFQLFVWKSSVMGLAQIMPTIAAVLTYIVLFLVYPERFQAAVIFSSLALFQMMFIPLGFLPQMLSGLIDCMVALRRIYGLLNAPVTTNPPIYDPDLEYGIQIVNGEFAWEVNTSKQQDSKAQNSFKDKKAAKIDKDEERQVLIDAKKQQKEDKKLEKDAFKVSNNKLFTNFQRSVSQTYSKQQQQQKQEQQLSVPSQRKMDLKKRKGEKQKLKKKVQFKDFDPSCLESKVILKDINVNIPKNRLTCIVGKIGSGKSSMLSAMVGDIKHLNGQVKVGGKISYCPQSPWIQNASVKDNILFGRSYDQKRYNRSLHFSQLENDLEILPDGDLTEIGERGVNLSGGQKARVNLARAIYADQEIIILDDVLAAVDATVGRFLFMETLKKELKNQTRILVTHQLHFVPFADYVIHLSEGRVTEQGTYEELMRNKGEFAQLLRNFGGISKESSQDLDPEKIKDLALENIKELEKQESQRSIKLHQSSKRVLSQRRISSKILDIQKTTTSKKDMNKSDIETGQMKNGGSFNKKKTEKGTLMTKEERVTGAVDGRIYLSYFKAGGGVFMAILFSSFFLGYQGANVATNVWLSYLIQSVGYPVSVRPLKIPDAGILVVYACLALAQGVMLISASVAFGYTAFLASKNLHKESYNSLIKAPMSFFDTTPQGRIINRFSRDIDQIDTLLVDAMRIVIQFIFTLLGIFVYISVNVYYFPAILVPMLVVYYFLQNFYRSTSRELKRLEAINRSPLVSSFDESLNGISTIKAYGDVDRFMELNLHHINSNNRPYYLNQVSQRWISTRLEVIGGVLIFCVGIFANVLNENKKVNPTLAGLALTYVNQVISLLNFSVRQIAETENYMNSVERVRYYIDKVPNEKLDGTPPPPDWPQNPDIEFDQVCLKYRPELSPALQNFSVYIPPKSKVGIVGRTGAGKSTIIASLMRLVELESGTVTIGGLDISQVPLRTVRSKVAIIPQDPILFETSIRRNLDPTENHTDAQIWDQLKQVGLHVHIQSMPHKLDTTVSSNGDNFSMGQKQLFCLVRAMMVDAKILIMDEATANVDQETDEKIQKTIRHRFQDCTVLTIAHRLNTVIDYDYVLLMEYGRCMEFDSPFNLLHSRGNQISKFGEMVQETGPTNSAMLYRIAKENHGGRSNGAESSNRELIGVALATNSKSDSQKSPESPVQVTQAQEQGKESSISPKKEDLDREGSFTYDDGFAQQGHLRTLEDEVLEANIEENYNYMFNTENKIYQTLMAGQGAALDLDAEFGGSQAKDSDREGE